MNREDVIRMAREADPAGEAGRLYAMADLTPDTIVRFAALVAAAEREEWEKKCDALLAHCEVDECCVCSQIICPEKCSMHFHHDGCPACEERIQS